MNNRSVYEFFHNEQVREPVLMGILQETLQRGKSIFSFEFDNSWLNNPIFQNFDPNSSLFRGKQYAPTDKDNFGVFLDSTPDRWGRQLIDRRETILARKEGRPVIPRTELDYLLGVFDDHLRNHGFLLTSKRWTLSPAYSLAREEFIAAAFKTKNGV